MAKFLQQIFITLGLWLSFYKILINTALCLLLILNKFNLFAQRNQVSPFSLHAEVVPYAVFYGGRADGFQISLERRILKNKFSILLTYGLTKRTYDLASEVGAGLVNGVLIVDKTTEASIFTPESMRGGGVPDQSLYEHLKEAGFKHYVPNDGAYITNYGTVEMLRKHTFKDKWDLDWGFGGQVGLMNRNEAGGGLSDSVIYFGQPIKTWITYRISARYLYYGFTSRLSFTRKITDHFSVGIVSGLHFIMAKGSTDDVKPYFSALAKCAF